MLIIDGEEKEVLLEHLNALKMFYQIHAKMNKGLQLGRDFEIAFDRLCELERRIGGHYETH